MRLLAAASRSRLSEWMIDMVAGGVHANSPTSPGVATVAVSPPEGVAGAAVWLVVYQVTTDVSVVATGILATGYIFNLVV